MIRKILITFVTMLIYGFATLWQQADLFFQGNLTAVQALWGVFPRVINDALLNVIRYFSNIQTWVAESAGGTILIETVKVLLLYFVIYYFIKLFTEKTWIALILAFVIMISLSLLTAGYFGLEGIHF